MTPFGARIRALREQRGMSLKQMATELNVSSAYLSALEHGQRGRPSPGLVMQILGCLNVIWDEAEEIKKLAELSHPRVTIDTASLPPAATELTNRLSLGIKRLPDETLQELLRLLKEAGL